MEQADIITRFTDQIRGLHEIDYGDFKRKVSLYVHRLQQGLDKDQLKIIQDLIQQMNHRVLYDPTGNIEGTRVQVLQLAAAAQERLRLRH